jgi:hypothetical protein
MNLTKILSIVFLVIAIGLAYFLVNSIKYEIDEAKRLELIESNVINKLKLIREAQIAYQSVNGQYTSDWDKLIAFIDTGHFYLTQRTELIETFEYGAEKVTVLIDTLGQVLVKDSVFSVNKYPNFKSEDLPFKPGTQRKVKFDIFADKIQRGNVTVDVFEVKDPKPDNPKRREKNNEKALRVGSRTDVTTAGNWE